MKKVILLFIGLLSCFLIFAQSERSIIASPFKKDFAPTLQFLASTELEGRETGTRGSVIAGNYLASLMHNIGLKPYQNASNSQLADFSQSFKLLKYTAEEAYIEIHKSGQNDSMLRFNFKHDFKVQNGFRSLSTKSVPVFAGYGIVAPELGYNDYAGIEVKGKIVILMEGYPGQHDTASIAFKKFKTVIENDGYDLDKKCLEATKKGALAIIILNKAFLEEKQGSKRQKNVAPVKNPDYTDAEYMLPANVPQEAACCFRLNLNSCEKLSGLLKVDFREAERQIASNLKFVPAILKNHFELFSNSVVDTLTVNNIVGMIQGKDTSQSVIIGAHYDHLGMRKNTVFYGSDDNASGVAGLLAIAKKWTGSNTIPAFNLIFACWTAEEKGLLGSEFFTSGLDRPDHVKLYINMDMISRSVSEDTAGRMLSIGTRTSDEYLRDMVKRINSTLDKPFTLDLWDVTGHSGSDYANFKSKNIPVMTFNTGLHDDYHTPADKPEKADLKKMNDVLMLVNKSLLEILENKKEN